MTNASQPPQNSTLSPKTEVSAVSEEVFALGQKIVSTLGEDASRDTLACWIAQHVADLITKAQTETGHAKQAAEKACFEAILTLWQHRSELPSGKRPFEDLEPIVRAIESLDPENNVPRYFRTARPLRGQTPENKAQADWLSIAEGLDYSARVLIGLALAEAAVSTIDKSQEWVKLAESAGFDSGPPELVVRFIKSTGKSKEPDPHKAERDFLADRARRLRGFISFAEQFASAIEEDLAKLPPPDDEGEDEDEIVLGSRPRLGE